MKRYLAVFVGLCAMSTVLLMLVVEPRSVQPDDTSPVEPGQRDPKRIFNAVASTPHMSKVRRDHWLEQSDRIRDRLEHDGGPDDIGKLVRARLHEVDVSDEDAQAWYDEHRSLFGERSFAQSRRAVERMIAISKVREELSIDVDP